MAPTHRKRKGRRARWEWLDRLLHPPTEWFPKEVRTGLAELLSTEEKDHFDAAMKATGKGQELLQELVVVGDQLANIALEAQVHGMRGSKRRIIWGVTSKTTGSLTAIASAAVGGTILGVNQLPPGARYALASVAFLAAALGALQPGAEYSADVLRHLKYSSLHHQILQYITVSLPHDGLSAATKELGFFSLQFDEIRGLEQTPERIKRSQRLTRDRPPGQ